MPTQTTPETAERERTALEPPYDVLLHDDDVHDTEYVTTCLQATFHVPRAEAHAIMSEAHCTGVALCCTEPRPEAVQHRNRLRAYGLTSTIEPA